MASRWESETTHHPFDDNNSGKTFGGRIGFTPVAREGLLNFGIGGSYGPEQDDTNSSQRWVIDLDATWNPTPRLLLAGELKRGDGSTRKGVAKRRALMRYQAAL